MNMDEWYPRVYNPNHHRADSAGMVYEHIIVAEDILGRNLSPEEVVHHEDEDKTNNSENNIYIFETSADHSRYHKNGLKFKNNEGTYYSPMFSSIFILECNHCGNEFETKDKRNSYCNQSCFKKSIRRTERPSKENLYNLLKDNPFTKVAEMFGVSDNTIRKWCVSYEIPSKAKYYKEKK